jgi:hypothetical protein
MPAVLDVIAPPVDDGGEELGLEGVDNNEEDDEVAASRDDAARWIMTYLGMKFPTEFVKAASEIGMPIHGKKMSAERAFAMWSDANINTTQQRIVNQHFAAFFGHRFTVPECEIRKLGLSFVEPKTATVEHENSKLTFSYGDLDTVIEKHVADKLQHNKEFKYDKIDVVVGGDYGQGAFRAGVKIIFWSTENGESKKHSSVLNIGSIECKKDSYSVLAKLAKTLGAKLDLALGHTI